MIRRFCFFKIPYQAKLRIKGSIQVFTDNNLAISISLDESYRKNKTSSSGGNQSVKSKKQMTNDQEPIPQINEITTNAEVKSEPKIIVDFDESYQMPQLPLQVLRDWPVLISRGLNETSLTIKEEPTLEIDDKEAEKLKVLASTNESNTPMALPTTLVVLDASHSKQLAASLVDVVNSLASSSDQDQAINMSTIGGKTIQIGGKKQFLISKSNKREGNCLRPPKIVSLLSLMPQFERK